VISPGEQITHKFSLFSYGWQQHHEFIKPFSLPLVLAEKYGGECYGGKN
jgi:hypothetical protein